MNIGSTKLSSPWKHYKREKKKLAPIQVRDRFHRLVVIEIQPQKKGTGDAAVIVCRCECSRIVKTHAATLRKGFIGACELDTALEKRMAKEIADALEVERLTSPHVNPSELPKREPWSYSGDEAALIAAQEQEEDAATAS
jgi:hypothetical protein